VEHRLDRVAGLGQGLRAVHAVGAAEQGAGDEADHGQDGGGEADLGAADGGAAGGQAVVEGEEVVVEALALVGAQVGAFGDAVLEGLELALDGVVAEGGDIDELFDLLAALAGPRLRVVAELLCMVLHPALEIVRDSHGGAG